MPQFLMMCLHRRLLRFLRAGVPCAVLAALAVGTACFAEDFQAQPTWRVSVFEAQYNWNNPKAWQTAAKANGVPATANDVGIVGKGHQIAVWEPLGTANSRPTIQVEPGGTLVFARDLVNPLTLAGGTLEGDWFGKTVAGPIRVTADSNLHTWDAWNNWQLRVGGPVSNSEPVSLHCAGSIEWRSDSRKTFSGTVAIDRGILGVTGPFGSSQLGTGPIVLASGTEFTFEEHFLLANDISGLGTVVVGNRAPTQTLIAKGVALHPGLPDRPGTLSIAGSLDFQRNAGQPAKLIIDVQGDGSSPTADYSQVAVLGNVTNSLDNVDLILQLKPDMPTDQAAALRLVVLTMHNTDLVGPHTKPFHSVQVIAGNRKGSASAMIKLDPMTGQDVVEVTGIAYK